MFHFTRSSEQVVDKSDRHRPEQADDQILQQDDASKDSLGRLRVGAAIGVGPDMMARAEALLKASADVIVIDTSHGHSQNVIDAVIKLKETFSDIELIAGNVGTAKGAEFALKNGAWDYLEKKASVEDILLSINRALQYQKEQCP